MRMLVWVRDPDVMWGEHVILQESEVLPEEDGVLQVVAFPEVTLRRRP